MLERRRSVLDRPDAVGHGIAERLAAWTFEIVGTDVNTEVLDTARRGVYSARALRNVEGDLLRRHFRPEGQLFCLNDEIKRSVRFEYANLTHVPLPRPSAAGQDIVFCKNVTIYFQPEMTRRLVRQLHDALAEGGFLLLGHSESLWQMDEGFALVEHDGAFCYRKAAPRVEAAPIPLRLPPRRPQASTIGVWRRSAQKIGRRPRRCSTP